MAWATVGQQLSQKEGLLPTKKKKNRAPVADVSDGKATAAGRSQRMVPALTLLRTAVSMLTCVASWWMVLAKPIPLKWGCRRGNASKRTWPEAWVED